MCLCSPLSEYRTYYIYISLFLCPPSLSPYVFFLYFILYFYI
uniref:Uncharacterized protein n=1 Tax=Arundo donax TaxID=35708 RepID=A0A0A9BQQ1_ARUDO